MCVYVYAHVYIYIYMCVQRKKDLKPPEASHKLWMLLSPILVCRDLGMKATASSASQMLRNSR